MKNNNAISMISGQSVPFNISYFPSVLPKDDVVLHGYVPTSSDAEEETKRRASLDGYFDRGTQTSFRGSFQKNKSNRSFPKINQLNEVFAAEDNKGPSSLPPCTHFPSDGEKDNIYQTNLKGASSVKAPLMRSASYEKAILSSMRELDYNIKCENKVCDFENENKTTSSKENSSKTFKNESDSFFESTSPQSSNKSLSSTLDKWKKRASFKKSNSVEDDKGLKLLKHEHVDASFFNDDEKQMKEKLWVKDVSFDEKKDSPPSVKEEKSNDIEMTALTLKENNDTKSTQPTTSDTSYKAVDNTVIVIGFKEKVTNDNGRRNEETDKRIHEGDEDKKEVNKLSSRKSSRAEAMIKNTYSCYPEGGGGGSEYPYLREMKERLLIAKDAPLNTVEDPTQMDPENQLLEVHQTPVGTVVKLNADGYGSHTSPTHRVESFYTGTLESRKTHVHEFPKNAKTSSFITLSMLYATLLVVVCLGFVLSEVLTHNVPLYYYEAFFTYLYGISILFLLYVFCYLLSGSTRELPSKNQVFMVRLSMLSLVTPLSSSPL